MCIKLAQESLLDYFERMQICQDSLATVTRR